MFTEFRDAAVEALLTHARARGLLPAFVAMAEQEDEDGERQSRLVDLSIELDETAEDLADCANGMHSWVDDAGLLPADTECDRCGELYGHPD